MKMSKSEYASALYFFFAGAFGLCISAIVDNALFGRTFNFVTMAIFCLVGMSLMLPRIQRFLLRFPIVAFVATKLRLV